MKHSYKTDSGAQTASFSGFRHSVVVRLEAYEQVLRRIATVKARVEREFSWAMGEYERVLKAALNEAEALAWQTPYPHLFFPALAEEKAMAAEQWATHQRWVRERSLVEAMAA